MERFLEHKHNLGFAYHREESFLSELDRLAQRRGDDLISEDLVRAYLSCFSLAARPHRLTLVRQLARFLFLEEPRTFVPSSRFLGIRRRRPVIRVLSREEASRFLDACDRLPDGLSFTQRVVHATALRLLLLTGLRCGEMLALKNRDVDLVDRMFTVTCGKGGKTRFVPLAQDLTHRLQAYQASLHFLNAQRPEASPHTLSQVLGLQNLDNVSTQYRPFKQLIERLNRTYKHHVRSASGFASQNGAVALTALFVTYYNFLRPHHSLGHRPPVSVPELAPITTLQGRWNKILQMALAA
jgi:integrase